MNFGYAAKAVNAALIAGLTTAGAALITPGISAAEAVTIALAVLGSFSTVFVTSNTPGPVRAVNVTVNPKPLPAHRPPAPPDAMPPSA